MFLRVIFLLIILFLAACEEEAPVSEQDEKVVVTVKEKTLTEEEIRDMVPQGLSFQDSLKYARQVAEQWAKRQVVLLKAEEELAADLNISKLVEEYKSNLLLHNYDQYLLKTTRDTSVAEWELRKHYEENHEDFVLSNPLIKCEFAYFTGIIPDSLEKIEKSWKENRDSLFLNYATDKAERWLLADTNWYNYNTLLSYVPQKFHDAIKLQDGFQTSVIEGKNALFYHCLSYMKAGEIAPFGYVRPNIKRVITHNKTRQILQQKKEKIYRDARKNNEVQFNVE